MASTFLAALLASLVSLAPGLRETVSVSGMSASVAGEEPEASLLFLAASSREQWSIAKKLRSGIASDHPLKHFYARAAETSHGASAYSRLLEAGSKKVLVAAEGLNMQLQVMILMSLFGKVRRTPFIFNLQHWYRGVTNTDMTTYWERGTREARLAAITKEAVNLRSEACKSEYDSLVVMGVDEADLKMKAIDIAITLRALSPLAACKKPIVLALHPAPSMQPEVLRFLSTDGFPQPGDSGWINFGESYSEFVEDALLDDIMSEEYAFKEASPTKLKAAKDSIKQYFGGNPIAYQPAVVEGTQIFFKRASKAEVDEPSLAADDVMKRGRRWLEEQIWGNIGGLSEDSRVFLFLATMMTGNPKITAEEAASAKVAVPVLSAALMHREGSYQVPPVMRDAIKQYCNSSFTDNAIIHPLCSAAAALAAWPPLLLACTVLLGLARP